MFKTHLRLWKFSKSIHLWNHSNGFNIKVPILQEEFEEIREKERLVMQQKSQDEEKERMGEGKENDLGR